MWDGNDNWNLLDFIKESEENNKELNIEEVEKINKKNLIRTIIICIPIFIIYLTTIIFSNSLIINLGIGLLNVIQLISSMSLILVFGIGLFNFIKTLYYISIYKKNLKTVNIKSDFVQKISENGNIEEDLKEIKITLPKNEEGIKSRKVIDECIELIHKMKDLQNILNVFIEGNQEYSLEEVITVINQASEKVNQNILKIVNRIALELTIDGFDMEKINFYIENNNKIIEESSKLIKESLDYMEGKENIDKNTLGIETLRETIQSLKALNQNKID